MDCCGPSPAGFAPGQPRRRRASHRGRGLSRVRQGLNKDLLVTGLEVATVAGTSVIITWFTGPTTEVETYGFPLPVAAGTALQTGLVGLTDTDRRARGTQDRPGVTRAVPEPETPATHCDHGRSARMLNHPARPHRALLNYPEKASSRCSSKSVPYRLVGVAFSWPLAGLLGHHVADFRLAGQQARMRRPPARCLLPDAAHRPRSGSECLRCPQRSRHRCTRPAGLPVRWQEEQPGAPGSAPAQGR
jgi:hypothetical protein